MNKTLKNRIDWVITLIPFLCIVALCLTFFTDPTGSSAMVDGIRTFLGEEFGWYYLTLGLGIFLITNQVISLVEGVRPVNCQMIRILSLNLIQISDRLLQQPLGLRRQIASIGILKSDGLIVLTESKVKLHLNELGIHSK